jgi:hypothetical protein
MLVEPKRNLQAWRIPDRLPSAILHAIAIAE